MKTGGNVEGTQGKLDIAQEELRKRQETALDALNLPEGDERLLAVMQEIVFLKGYRKDAVYHAHAAAEPLMKEIASRLGISLALARTILPPEMRGALVSGKVDRRKLEARLEHSIIEWNGSALRELEEKEIPTFLARIPAHHAESSEITQLTGQCACPGMVRGLVKIVNVPSEMGKMEQGNILASHATNPDLVPAMKKAAAIVTDVGGITCHAAIVSRELGIPCVIGTKLATKALSDGELVEVDATHGVVRKLASK